jgi:hypothetical protein
MTKKNNKMKMVKDPKTGKMVPEFAVKKAAGKTVKKKMMAGGKEVKKKMMAGGKQVKKGYAAGKMVKKKMMAGGKMVKKMMSSGKLVGGQTKIDKNKDGKITGDDFALLRKGNRMAGGKMVKKMMSGGGKTKGMANGGKKKSKPKVRGAGKAIKGVRPAKMR